MLLLYTVVGTQVDATIVKNHVQFPQEIKNSNTIQSSIPLWVFTQGELKH